MLTSHNHRFKLYYEDREFLWNISTTAPLLDVDGLHSKTTNIQLIQQTQEDHVEIHELRVTRDILFTIIQSILYGLRWENVLKWAKN